MAAAYIPIVTIEALASDAQQEVATRVQTMITSVETQLEALKALKSDDSIRKKLVDKYAQVPTLTAPVGGLPGAPKVMTLQKIQGMGGKQGTEMEVGAIFAKYYGLAKLAEEIQDPANKALKFANIPAKLGADVVTAAKATKDQYAAAIQQTDELLQKISAAREYEETRYMQVFTRILGEVEADCQVIRSALFQHMNSIYAPNKQVSYPELSESFRGREISYQIEPSGVQGAGRETRFLFQDFLKSRGVDEDSD